MANVDLSAADISPEQRKHLPKDQYKSDRADVLIVSPTSRGASGEYMRLWRKAGLSLSVNPGEYTGKETVFVSANGKRRGSIPPHYTEIRLAVEAGCTFLTDGRCRRPEGGNPYNIGEQEVAYMLREARYAECHEFEGLVCRWTPVTVFHEDEGSEFFVLRVE